MNIKSKIKPQSGEMLYINFVQMWGSRKREWIPCWYDKYLGSTRLDKAVALRNEFLAFLVAQNTDWKSKHLKTVTIEL